MLILGGLDWKQWDIRKLYEEGYAQNPIVNACVGMIAEAASSVKLEVHAIDVKGEKTVLISHDVLKLMTRPNPMQGGREFVQELVTFHRITGEAFILKIADAKGQVRELYNLDPARMKVIPPKNGSAIPVAYEYGDGEKKETYTVDALTGRSDILHIRVPNPSSIWRGLSPLGACARWVDIHNAGAAWNHSLLKNSARPSGIVQFTGTPPDGGVIDQLREHFKKAWQGTGNAGGIPMLTGGAEFKPLSHNPKDMDFAVSVTEAAKNIALVYGVPLPLVTTEASTFSNVEMAGERFWTDTVLPLLDEVIGALSGFLFPPGSREVLAYNADSVPALEPRRQRLYDRMGKAVAAGLLTQNEARVEMGFDELADADQLKPIDKAGTPDPAASFAKSLKAAGFSDEEVRRAVNDEFGSPKVAA